MSTQLIVNIDVPDVRAAIAFYRDGLGFALHRTLFDGSVAEMTSGFGNIFLIEQPPDSTAVADTSIVRDYARHWTPVHLDVAVEDISEAVSKALAAGATVAAPMSVNAFGKLAPMCDPFGNGFCFIEFNDRGYDAVATPI
jgi:predicted enzyme related to lactoylglutathione lyase